MYCDFSSRIVCKFLPKTQPSPFSAHRRQGGPFSSIRHLIYSSSASLHHTTCTPYLLSSTRRTSLDLSRDLWRKLILTILSLGPASFRHLGGPCRQFRLHLS